MFAAKILADSLSPFTGTRLTTMEVTFPRIVLAEFNTHRMLSRNSASSRAIPVEKRIVAVEEDPFVPEQFGRNQKGMQAVDNLADEDSRFARDRWLCAAGDACRNARYLAKLGVHKQLANRLLEPFLWHTVIVSATEWRNFFALRCHSNAQPEIRTIAEMMRDLMKESTPLVRTFHRPLVEEEEKAELIAGGMTADDVDLVAVGRCARVSYLTHDGRRDPVEDLALAKRLSDAGHMSPFEHVAFAVSDNNLKRMVGFFGNFRGWMQFRKSIVHEEDFSLRTDGVEVPK